MTPAFTEGFHAAAGVLAAVGIVAAGLIFGAALTHYARRWFGRYRQAGRKGYGFEKTGWARVRQAFTLFWRYEVFRD